MSIAFSAPTCLNIALKNCYQAVLLNPAPLDSRRPQSAPPTPPARTQFLGVFKTLADAGNFLGPLLAGAIAQWLGLDAACLAASAVGAMGALYYMVCGVETRADAPARSVPNKRRFVQ